MRAWAFMLGGLAVWAVHFLGVYGIASIADVVAEPDAAAARGAVAALTVICLAAAALLLIAAWRAGRRASGDLARFAAWLAGLGAALALVAVAWQGLPALVGH